MSFPLDIPDPVRRRLEPGTGVLLGLSGGVDSAVTLAVLQHLECDVQCVTFKNFCYGSVAEEAPEQACCSLESIEEARQLARRYDSPHWVSSVEEPFRVQVIEPFIGEYLEARTPNPCLLCNGEIRFPELVRLAERQGCAYAATGHYARVEEHAGGARLLKGLDPAKDQSYFLHRVDPSLFGRLLFPLGWCTKDQVRQAATKLGIPAATKRDSQEICFVPDGDRSFLFEGEGPALEPGDIVDTEGNILGRHRGLVHYTIGQRKGLGVAAADPLYVLELNLEQRRLVVGAKNELAVTYLEADRFQPSVAGLPADWNLEQELPDGLSGPVTLRVRHRHEGAPVQGWMMKQDGLKVRLNVQIDGAAPGQGCVLYAGDVVLGGGRILYTARPTGKGRA